MLVRAHIVELVMAACLAGCTAGHEGSTERPDTPDPDAGHQPAQDAGPPPPSDRPARELASAPALARLGDWRALPTLERAGRYIQQTSRDRGSDDDSFPLSGNGNRDFNNFRCASDDAQLSPLQFAPFAFDRERCEERYVQGVVLARFVGSGHLVRMWIGMASLLAQPADEEVLRIYRDGREQPLLEVSLAAALDGSAGEMFAPPFGAGSPFRLAWYYPVAFQEKLIVTLDRLGALDEYYYHCDVVLEDEPQADSLPSEPLPERDAARRQLAATEHAAELQPLGESETLELAPSERRAIRHSGPFTVHELRVSFAQSSLSALADVHVAVRWDDDNAPAIDLPLLSLFAVVDRPPERASVALGSDSDGEDRVLWLRLPMPFAVASEWSFDNRGDQPVRLELALLGEPALPDAPFGMLHVRARETVGPTTATEHVAVDVEGAGRLAGLCGRFEGRPDPEGGVQYDPLNLLEGDVRATVDGELALDGTGTEEYADDVFYFTDTPHASAFAQAWGRRGAFLGSSGQVDLCRWHVLGTELDFERALDLRFELGGAGNPDIVDRIRTIAYLYLP